MAPGVFIAQGLPNRRQEKARYKSGLSHQEARSIT
jgi:hypothetical protein